jgi:hypothetical protein
MLAEIGLSVELVEEVQREHRERVEKARVERIFRYVLGDIEEIDLGASDVEHALKSVESNLQMAVSWLKVGEVKHALEELKEALQEIGEALNDIRRVEFQAEEAENYIRYAYFNEPLFEGDDC